MTSKLGLLCLLLFCLNACQSTDKKTGSNSLSAPTTGNTETMASAKALVTPLDSARCYGTEPFWVVEIGEKKGTLIYKSISEEQELSFPYAKPVVTDSTWTYEAKAGHNSLIARMKKEVCSDGMSDITHPFSSEVVINGKILRGCGVRF
jgi:uncharacterized membrane protein